MQTMASSQHHPVIPLFALTLIGLAGCHESNHLASTVADTASPSVGMAELDEPQRKRLGIETSPVRSEVIRSSITKVGWLMLPPTGETVIRAPLSGFTTTKPKQDWPVLGQQVASNQALAQLNVFLSPQEVSQLVHAKEENDTQIQQSLVTMQLTEAQLKHLSTARDAVAGIRVDQLKEAFERSKAAYQAAQDKVPFLIQEPYVEGVIVKPVSIEIPQSGRILQSHVTAGQFVQTGDPLWTVADWSTLWLRVPIFAGDTERIDTSSAAEIPNRHGAVTKAAAIALPNAMKPGTRTIDLFYAVANPAWKYRVGQSTAVELPTKEEAQALTIPLSSVLYDGFGQAFCYASKLDPIRFQRRRIELGARLDDRVVVLKGLTVAETVISVGAEQFSADESKAELSAEDD